MITTEKDLNSEEAAEYLGCTVNDLKKLRAERRGPPFSRVQGGHVRYRLSDLADWSDGTTQFYPLDITSKLSGQHWSKINKLRKQGVLPKGSWKQNGVKILYSKQAIDLLKKIPKDLRRGRKQKYSLDEIIQLANPRTANTNKEEVTSRDQKVDSYFISPTSPTITPFEQAADSLANCSIVDKKELEKSIAQSIQNLDVKVLIIHLRDLISVWRKTSSKVENGIIFELVAVQVEDLCDKYSIGGQSNG